MLAAGGGLLLSAAFPGIGLAGAAWVAPGLILFSALGCSGGRAFWLGFVGGLAHYLSSLYWLLAMPDTIYGVPVGPAAGWFFLSAYCALFPAVWVWLCWRIWASPPVMSQSWMVGTPRRGVRSAQRGVPANPLTPITDALPPRGAAPLPAGAVLDQFLASGLWQRGRWAICSALIWVALEMARGRLLTGFPWNFLGVSQYKMLPLIQIAAVTGVYGVSFLVVWMSVALAMALLALARQPGRGVWGEAGVPLLAAAVAASFGASKVAKIEPAPEALRVALVQPAFAQGMSLSESEEEARLKQMIALSEKALADQPSLLIWPEGAMSGLTPEHQAALAGLTARHGTWLVATADLSEVTAQGATEYFNSSILLNPKGEVAGFYHKRKLVIFGEYVPRWLAFLKWVTPINGEFTPGKEPVQFVVTAPQARFSALICFEDTFAEEAREHATPETDFLVNLTDDGWYGNGPAVWQHAANAVFRAVENGVPLVRCTNNGLTCWIDAQGRLREIFSVAGNVFGAGFMTANIPLRPNGERGRTFYNLHGDWFGWSCCAMSLCLGAATIRSRRRQCPGLM